MQSAGAPRVKVAERTDEAALFAALDACGASWNERGHSNGLVYRYAKVNDVLEGLTQRYNRTGDCVFSWLSSEGRPSAAYRDTLAPD